MNPLLRGFGALVGLVLSTQIVQADVVVLTPDRDNSMHAEGQLSNGANDSLFVGATSPQAAGASRRALVRFDLSSIPPGSTINSVSLAVEVVNASPFSPGATAVQLHRVEEDWGEAGSNNTTFPGQGDAAQAGDATWTDRIFPGTTWSTAGGTFQALASATTFINAPGSYAFSSAQMAADVQFWRGSPGQNFGWILIGDEGQLATAKRISSREAPADNPALTVGFTPPLGVVPTMDEWALLAMGALLAGAGAFVSLRRA